MSGISSNPLPRDPSEGIEPINFPNPIAATRKLFGRVKNIPSSAASLAGFNRVSATYGFQGNNFSIDFRNSKAGGLVVLERVRPVSRASELKSGLSVDSLVFAIPRKGGQPVFVSARHHVQSIRFGILAPEVSSKGVKVQGVIREGEKGAEAAHRIAPNFADELVAHGIEYLEGIEDPKLALTAAFALSGIQTAFTRPEKAFGRKGMANGQRKTDIDGYNPFIEIASRLYDQAHPTKPSLDPLMAL